MKPDTAALFDRFGIDYFCAGNRLLGDALKEHNVPFDAFAGELSRIDQEPADPDWRTAPLRMLIAHIIDTHHVYLRRELPVLDSIVEALTHRAIADKPALLPELYRMVRDFRRDLELQMWKEEAILFPAVSDLETRGADDSRASPFGSVANLLRVLTGEHEKSARALHEICELSERYTPTESDRAGLTVFYTRLPVLVADIHRHLHLENNILYLRAARLEKGEYHGTR